MDWRVIRTWKWNGDFVLKSRGYCRIRSMEAWETAEGCPSIAG